MGLEQQLLAGAALGRSSIAFLTDAVGSGSIDLGSVFAILGIEVDSPCRIRFYDHVSGRDNGNEINRSFGDVGISASVALIADISMSQAGVYTTDPIFFGYSEVNDPAATYYRIEPSSPQVNVSIRKYLLEDNAVTASAGSNYSVANRRNLPEINVNLGAGALTSASIADSSIPQTYLLISASLSGSNNTARLRLYTTESVISDIAEQSRSFATEITGSNAGYLIADMVLYGSEDTFFTPKIVGANLQNIKLDLDTMIGNQAVIQGENELYYILENEGGSAADISASLHVFALED